MGVSKRKITIKEHTSKERLRWYSTMLSKISETGNIEIDFENVDKLANYINKSHLMEEMQLEF